METQNNIILIIIILITPSIPLIGFEDIAQTYQYSAILAFSAAIFLTSGFYFGVSIFKNKLNLRLKVVDVLIIVLLGYLAVNGACIKQIQMFSILGILVFLLFYILIRQISSQFLGYVFIGIVISGIIQAVYGNLQLYSIYPSRHNLFKLTGSFFNPGPYSGYLISILPIGILGHFANSAIKAPDWYKWLSDKSSVLGHMTFQSLIKYVSAVLIISVILVLPATRSRASWVAACISTLYILFQIRGMVFSKYREQLRLSMFYNFFKSPILKAVTIVAFVILFGSSLIALYFFKQGSADGRLLIWRVATQMIKEKTLFGFGTNGFKAYYMNYQAAFFTSSPEREEAMVADNSVYAFNEFIRIAVEQGLIGLLIILIILGILFFGKISTKMDESLPPNIKILGSKEKNVFLPIPVIAARGGLLAGIGFAFFSYPLSIVPIMMGVIIFAAIIAHHQKKWKIDLPWFVKTKWIRKSLAIPIIVLSAWGMYILSTQYKAMKQWKDASDIYHVQAYNTCLKNFELAYPLLKTNGDFLIQYGKALSMAEKHEEAVEVLTHSKKYISNTILYTTLGDSYKALGEHRQAEHAYKIAWNMVPSRFYPLYLLTKLYDEIGQKEKAYDMATYIMSKKVKVHSRAIEEIKEEMETIINKYANLSCSNNLKEKDRKPNQMNFTASCQAPSQKGKEV